MGQQFRIMLGAIGLVVVTSVVTVSLTRKWQGGAKIEPGILDEGHDEGTRYRLAGVSRDVVAAARGVDLRRHAAELATAGEFRSAVEVLDGVISRPDSPFDRFSALRMKGQYLKLLGETARAKDCFGEAVAMADADESLKQYGISYASTVQQYSALVAIEGNLELASSLNERLTRLVGSTDEYGVAEDAIVRNVQLKLQAGDRQGAAVAIDRLFERSPNYGRDNGLGIQLRLMRADLVDPTMSTRAYVETVERLWNSAEFYGAEGMLEVGARLAGAFRARGDVESAIQTEVEIVRRADVAIAAMNAGGGAELTVERLVSRRDSSLNALTSAGEYGHTALALDALVRLRDASKDAVERAAYTKEIELLRDRE